MTIPAASKPPPMTGFIIPLQLPSDAVFDKDVLNDVDIRDGYLNIRVEVIMFAPYTAALNCNVPGASVLALGNMAASPISLYTG